jgi:hypothetical protein
MTGLTGEGQVLFGHHLRNFGATYGCNAVFRRLEELKDKK